MTAMSDLPEDLMIEIFSRVPLKSLKTMRLTCKKWTDSSKKQIIGKASAARKKFRGLMTLGYRIFSMDLDLQGTHNDGDLVDPSLKQVRKLDQAEIYNIFHSEGLLLCVSKDENKSLVVCNPYLGQMKWIQNINSFKTSDMYALGYDNNRCNHKILRLFGYDYFKGHTRHEIYDFNSDSWRFLDIVSKWNVYGSGVSLKGSTYFVGRDITRTDCDCLLSFNFTSERFGPSLPLPFDSYFRDVGNMVVLSCLTLRDERLAVLHQHNVAYHDHERCGMMEIWITAKIGPDEVSLSKFLKLDITRLNRFPQNFVDYFEALRFFIDEEEKMVVVSCKAGYFDKYACNCPKAFIIREDRYFKAVNLREALHLEEYPHDYECTEHILFSSYVPSLVQLQTKQPDNKKEQDY